MEGYYWDPLKKIHNYGESENAFPTIEESIKNQGQSSVKDLSGKLPPGVVESGAISQEDFDTIRNKDAGIGKSSLKGVAKALTSKGNIAEKAGAGLTEYGVATANPYLVGAGLVTGAIGSNVAAKRQQLLDAYKDRMAKLENMTTIGRSIGS